MKLSVIISSRNELVMLNITLNNLLESFKGLNYKCEVVICDNSDDNYWKLLPSVIPTTWTKRGLVRVLRQEQPCFTSARMTAAKEAKGEYILCVDSHVLFGLRTIHDSVDFMDRRKDDNSLAFGHPPIRWAHQGDPGMKHSVKVSPDGLPNGGWGLAYREESPMFWKFMPWICRRDWYLNVLNGYGTHSEKMISWGGAEMIQQMKALMLGYTNYAIITDPVIHIGPYTPEIVKLGGYKYRTYTQNGNQPHGFGVILGFYILGGEGLGYKHAKIAESQIKNRHNINVDDYWAKAIELGKEEHEWLMARAKISYQDVLSYWSEKTS
jgi:glycosyltransferase involved in cell wall biosynthesis